MTLFRIAALAASLVLLSGGLSGAVAEPLVWQPAAGHTQVALWPGTPPDQPDMPGPETLKDGAVANVTKPTLTVYAPTVKSTGATVIVIPGGGFEILAIDFEGTEICDWLTSKGVTCVLLKYRVPSIPFDWRCKCRPHNMAISTPSLEDVQRTIRLARAHAGAWNIDPHKVGILGFSAGGFLVAQASTHYKDQIYAPVDAADRESSRPDFAVGIYPGHLALDDNSIALNPVIADHITPDTPPTFLLQNEDDNVDQVEDAMSYFMGLKKAGVPAELHVFAKGGHAFGLRKKNLPVDDWPHLVERWMRSIGMMSD